MMVLNTNQDHIELITLQDENTSESDNESSSSCESSDEYPEHQNP